jgi:hypothetical protein
MGSQFRPTTIDDQERLIEFLTRTFSLERDAPFVNPELLRWKYWEPRPDFSDPRSLVIENEGQIVAHVGLWPVAIRRSGGIERGLHMIDWASGTPGAGLSLVQRLTRSYDFIYGIGGSEMTQAVLPKFGFRSECETVTWSRPIRPLKQIVYHQTRDIRLGARFARNFSWSVHPARRHDRRWAARRATADDAAALNAVTEQRDPQFFSYIDRYFGSRSLLFRIMFEGRTAGLLLLVVTGLQVRLAGAWLENASEEGWRAVFELAQEAASSWAATPPTF